MGRPSLTQHRVRTFVTLMTAFLPLSHLARRFCLLAALLPLLVCSAFAQGSTGTITGRVFDEGSTRSLQGAVVTVRGTNASAYTDADGRFSIPGVRSGPV